MECAGHLYLTKESGFDINTETLSLGNGIENVPKDLSCNPPNGYSVDDVRNTVLKWKEETKGANPEAYVIRYEKDKSVTVIGYYL